jgi:radical SAM superfamily enzyme YgiQ (UPF0313 family)
MKILLLYPKIPADTFWSFKHVMGFIGKRASLPPMGLATVAALLPKEWEKRLVDLNVQKLRDKDLHWADLVFISAINVQQDSARELIARCKAAGKTVVAGGPLFTLEYEQFGEVDHFVLNEAEVTLPEFLKDFERGQARRVYTSNEFAEIKQTPAPLWELVRLKRYASASLQFSRGCPYNCDFCSVSAMLGRRPRTKTVAQVIAELDILHQLGWRGAVFFVDDNFIGNKQFLKAELLPALIAWQKKNGYSTPFFTEASINLADDDELMKLMVEAGFNQVFIGIETPDQASLAECRKLQNQKRDLVKDVNLIQSFGLEVMAGFIIGFDHDDETIFKRMKDFIQRSGIVTAMVGLLQAIPGTPLHERLEKEHRLIGDTTGNNSDATCNFRTTMNPETLRQGYRDLIRYIYSPGPFNERIRRFFEVYRRPKVTRALNWNSIRAFLYANVRLGIIGRERFHYWSLLVSTVFRRPFHFPLAVTLSIYRHHFSRVAESILAVSRVK